MMKKVYCMSFTAAMIAMLLSLTSLELYAAGRPNRPMTPEVAAKRENFRKQHEQRVTQPQRDVAAQSLKDKRKQILRAKRAAKRGLIQNPQSPQ